jgi:hypothetical protein
MKSEGLNREDKAQSAEQRDETERRAQSSVYGVQGSESEVDTNKQ